MIGTGVHHRHRIELHDHAVLNGCAIADSGGGEHQREFARTDLEQCRFVCSVERIGGWRECARAAAPDAARGHGHRAVQDNIRVVRAYGHITSRIGRRCRRIIQPHGIRGSDASSITCGGQREPNPSRIHFGRARRVDRVQAVCAGRERSRSPGPCAAVGIGHRSVQLRAGVVRTQCLCGPCLSDRCWDDRDRKLLGDCIAKTIARTGERDGRRACGDLGCRGRVGCVQLVRRRTEDTRA